MRTTEVNNLFQMIWANHIATQKHQPNIYQTNTVEDVYWISSSQPCTNYPHLRGLTWIWEPLTHIISHIKDAAKNRRMLFCGMYLGNANGQFAPPARAICTL